MKILIDENRYLTCFCIDAELDGGIEVETPEDIDAFIDAFSAYRYDNGNLVLDQDRLDVLNGDRIKHDLRRRREKECFSYINRGELWYGKLSTEQKYELDVWYSQWLDVTTTREIPTKPDWLI